MLRVKDQSIGKSKRIKNIRSFCIAQELHRQGPENEKINLNQNFKTTAFPDTLIYDSDNLFAE